MSWDVLIQNLPDVPSVDDIPADFEPRPLGTRQEVIDRIRAAFPQADFRDPSWGNLDGPNWSIEIGISTDNPSRAVMLHVRGGDEALPVVTRIIDAVGHRAIDTTTGEFFELNAARQSFTEWRNCRNQIAREYGIAEVPDSMSTPAAPVRKPSLLRRFLLGPFAY